MNFDDAPLAVASAKRLPLSTRAILRFLGLSHSSKWDEVGPKLTAMIAGARRAGDEDLAKTWSEAKEVLKKRLTKTCADCGCAVSPKAIRCRVCSKRYNNRGIKREHRFYKPTNEAIARWILAQSRFTMQQACLWTATTFPSESRTWVQIRTRDAVVQLKRHGLVRGGSRAEWGHFEIIRSEADKFLARHPVPSPK